ncbi:hypothetical protein B5K06_00750 [Rhizobium grahamii]|uniref:Uncharacterized protein n=2 Tax=Rhizobium grahamii TaxID=1120045 RepID=A0A370KWY8_9HYPH|nr:hypothetical protein B5K06_00750 [Rhizobium grahamii]
MIVSLDHLARDGEAHSVDIICANPDFWQRLADTWNVELAEPSKVLTADQREVWRKLAQLDGLFSIRPPRGPVGPTEAAELAKVKAARVRYAQQAVDLPRSFFGIRTDSKPA